MASLVFIGAIGLTGNKKPATVHAYRKRTIKNQYWEILLIESKDKKILSETHLKKDGSIIKTVNKPMSSEQAKAYKAENKDYLIERYQTDNSIFEGIDQ
jgi:hypothetical protein